MSRSAPAPARTSPQPEQHLHRQCRQGRGEEDDFERFRAIEDQLALISEKLGIPYEDPADTGAVPREVVELVHAGKRLEAVTRYRELTNASHNEAREAISGL